MADSNKIRKNGQAWITKVLDKKCNSIPIEVKQDVMKGPGQHIAKMMLASCGEKLLHDFSEGLIGVALHTTFARALSLQPDNIDYSKLKEDVKLDVRRVLVALGEPMYYACIYKCTGHNSDSHDDNDTCFKSPEEVIEFLTGNLDKVIDKAIAFGRESSFFNGDEVEVSVHKLDDLDKGEDDSDKYEDFFESNTIIH